MRQCEELHTTEATETGPPELGEVKSGPICEGTHHSNRAIARPKEVSSTRSAPRRLKYPLSLRAACAAERPYLTAIEETDCGERDTTTVLAGLPAFHSGE